MDEVADRNHLELRKGVWYYRRRVPDDVAPVIGKTFIKKSLKTGSIKEAQKGRNVLDVRWDAEFAAAREAAKAKPIHPKLKIKKASKPAPISKQQTLDLVVQYVQLSIEKFEDSVNSAPPESIEQKHDLLVEQQFEVDALMNPESDERQRLVSAGCDKIFGDISAEAITGEEAAGIVRRGLLEIARRKMKILEDEYEVGGLDPLFQPKPEELTSFGSLATQYLDQEKLEAQHNDHNAQWVEKVSAHVEFLIEFVGEDTPISKVDYDTAQQLRNTVAVLPKNRQLRYPGLSIENAIAAGKNDDADTMAPDTQRRYLDHFRKILDLGVAKGLLTGNPALNLKPLKKDKVKAGQKRPPFSPEQIAEFFWF